MTPEELINIIDKHGWVIGPRYKAGAGNNLPRNGWYIYADWEVSGDSTYALEPDEYALGIGATLEEAVRAALRATPASVSAGKQPSALSGLESFEK